MRRSTVLCIPLQKGFRGKTYHVVVNKDLLRSGLHLVVVGVADDDGQGGGSGHGRVSAVLDDDRDLVLLLLLAVERPQGRHDGHPVAVGTLCHKK